VERFFARHGGGIIALPNFQRITRQQPSEA
jgi:hypothetical protein